MQLKQRPDWPTYLRQQEQAAAPLLTRDFPIPDQGAVYATGYNCPDHGVPLRFDESQPHEHVCPVDGKVYRSAALDAEWYKRLAQVQHARAVSAALQLGRVYSLSGDERYAACCRDILVAYARKFPGYVFHDGFARLSPAGHGMRVSYEPLGESTWLYQMIAAYDHICDSSAVTPRDRELITAMLKDDVRVSLSADEGLSNRQCRHNEAIGALGLCLGDERLVRAAIGSFNYQMQYSIMGDGLWWEGSPAYHQFSVSMLTDLIRIFRRSGIDLSANLKYRLAFDGLLNLQFPDGTVPSINDGHFGMTPDRNAYAFIHELTGDSRYAAAAGVSGAARVDLGPVLMPETGAAVLHMGTGTSRVNALLDFGPPVLGHGHADKLNLVLFANGRTQAPDIGSRSYFSPVWRFWDRQTLSHNTVVIDEHSQLWEWGRLDHYDVTPGLQVVAASADGLYDGVAQERSLVLLDTASQPILIDFFRVTADSATPLTDIPGWIKEPRDSATPAGQSRGAVAWTHSTIAHGGRFSAAIAHSSGVPARWCTPLTEFTGQNRLWRRGKIAVVSGVRYRLSGWIKLENATGETHIAANWISADGALVGSMWTAPLHGTADWRQVEIDGAAPASAACVQLECSSGDNAGTAWFDDLEFAPVSGAASPRLQYDFEAVTAPHKTVDWMYHNFGTPAVQMPLTAQTVAMGDADENDWTDGVQGYRFLRDQRWGATDKAWIAEFRDDSGAAECLTMLGAPGTRIMLADGQGPETQRLPVLMARRAFADTVFTVVHTPRSANTAPPRVSAVTVCDAGGRVPAQRDAAAVEVADGNGEICCLRSWMRGMLHAAAVTSDARVAVVRTSGGRCTRAYLLDGTTLQMPDLAIHATPPAPCKVVDFDDARKTITVDTALPPGDALHGLPLRAAAPYDLCFTIDAVEQRGKQSVVHLGGLPNLQLRRGMPVEVDGSVNVAALNGDVYRIIAHTPATIRVLPHAQHPGWKVIAATGRNLPLPVAPDGRWVSVATDPTAGGPAEFYLVPTDVTGNVTDTAAPAVALKLDGKAVAAADVVETSRRPQFVEINFRDADSDIAAVNLDVDGKPLHRESAVIRRGRTAAVRLTDLPAGWQQLVVTARDASLLGNTAAVTVRVVKPFEVISDPQAESGKAVLMNRADSALDFAVPLDAGTYTVNVVARCPDDGTNSLFLDLDGVRSAAVFHLAVGKYGPCSRTYELNLPPPTVTIPADGPHRFHFTLREAPGAVIDRVEIFRDGRLVKKITAADLSG